jgi:hypothetical protein
VLSVEDWAELRRLHRAEQMPIKQSPGDGVSKNTVKRALAASGPPRYQRPARASVVDGEDLVVLSFHTVAQEDLLEVSSAGERTYTNPAET